MCNALVENLFVSFEFSGHCERVNYFAVSESRITKNTHFGIINFNF